MNMLRGALVFLVLVLIAAFACKHEQNESASDTAAAAANQTSAAASGTVFTLCNPNVIPAGQTLCPTEPCEIDVAVNNSDHSATADKPIVYIADTQSIVWKAKENAAGKKSHAEMLDVHFLDKNVTKHNKTGTYTAKKQPVCNGTDCSSNGTDFDPCQAHTYYAYVKHTHDNGQAETKTADPEIEVAGTTSNRNDTTGTGGTSGTSGTH